MKKVRVRIEKGSYDYFCEGSERRIVFSAELNGDK